MIQPGSKVVRIFNQPTLNSNYDDAKKIFKEKHKKFIHIDIIPAGIELSGQELTNLVRMITEKITSEK